MKKVFHQLLGQQLLLWQNHYLVQLLEYQEFLEQQSPTEQLEFYLKLHL